MADEKNREVFGNDFDLFFFSCGIKPPREFTESFEREPTITANFPAGTGHHGKFAGFFQLDFLPRKRPPWDFTGSERANLFVAIFVLIDKQYLCMHDT